ERFRARHVRIDVLQVRQLALVELLVDIGLDLALEERTRGRDDVVVGMAGEELGLEDLVRVEHVVVDADAVFPLEIRDHARLDVVGPVIDVENLLGLRRLRTLGLRARAAGGAGQQRRAAETKVPESGSATHSYISAKHSAAGVPSPRS